MAGAAHHPIEQVLREDVAPAAEQFGSYLLIELFGVEHQAIEVEDDGAGRGVALSSGFRVQQWNRS